MSRIVSVTLDINLRCFAGWDVKVVIPSSQKSWIGETVEGLALSLSSPDDSDAHA